MTWDLIGQFKINFYLQETNNYNYKKEKMLNKIKYYDTNNSKHNPSAIMYTIFFLIIIIIIINLLPENK
jgi:preprotein translocase subunit Sec61beta